MIASMTLSCAKGAHEPVFSGTQVEFALPEVENVKAAFVEDAGALAEGYGVYALKYTSDQDKTLFMNNVRVYRKSDDVWGYDEEYFWSPGAYHMFFAVYPYEGTGKYYYASTELGMTVTQKDGAAIETGVGKNPQDILYAVKTFDSEPFDPAKTPEKVFFNMRHAFSCVRFDVVNHSDFIIEKVQGKIWGKEKNGILPGLYDTATSLMVSGSEARSVWDGRGIGDGKFEFSEDAMNLTQGAETKVFEEIVIPQNINTTDTGKDKVYLHLTVYFKGEKSPSEFSVCLSDIELASQEALYKKTYLPGKRYRYALNVTSDYVSCGVTLVDWDEDDIIDL